jgi:hypothetical protein
MATQKAKLNKKLILFVALFILLIALISILLLNKKNNPLIGKWTTEQGTIYQFDKDYTGKLIVSVGEYKFKYTLEDDTVFVDFESESSVDTKFNYRFEDDKLILESKNGTFTFTKIDL